METEGRTRGLRDFYGCGVASFNLVLALACGLPSLVRSQETVRIRTSPYLPFEDPEPARYNFKWKNLEMRLKLSMEVEFNDNINVAAIGPEEDISFGPRLGLGFRWLQSKDYQTEFNLDLTYRWYLQHSELNTFGIAPSSAWSHRILIDENTQLVVYDQIAIVYDPTTRADVSGVAGNLLTFRRINNTAGTQIYWQGYEDLTLSAGYNYIMDRSLSDDFSEIDKDTHSFNANAYYQLTPRWTVGLTGLYNMNRFCENINNDSDSLSYGPVVAYKPSRFITIQGGFSYIFYMVDQTGTTLDTSESDGFNYEFAVIHEANSRMKHSVRLRNSINTGLASNTIETLSTQYNIDLRIGSSLNLSSRFAYENFTSSSIRGDTGDRFLYSLGLAARLTPNWSAGLNYALAIKDSDLPDRDYVQNRFILDFNKQF